MIEIIYCGGGNPRFYEIATQTGFLYGAQLPDTVYGPLHFADQNWKNPNRERYIAELKKHRPFMASVLDWESPDQLEEVLGWAEDAAQFVETVMIIPKVIGGIARLPRVIGGKVVRLGYSVPTRHGGTSVPVWEFYGWPIHLLGGNPHRQYEIARYINVISIDGNMAQKMATRYCAFYDPTKRTEKGYWPNIQICDGEKWGDGTSNAGAPYEAFRRSCEAIMGMWENEGTPGQFSNFVQQGKRV